MSSGIGNSVDRMYRSERNIRSGIESSRECGSKKGKFGARTGAAIGALALAPVPPCGAWSFFVGAPVGALIGWIIGEVCNNERHQN